jgi:hypothetical protein
MGLSKIWRKRRACRKPKKCEGGRYSAASGVAASERMGKMTRGEITHHCTQVACGLGERNENGIGEMAAQ